MSTLCPKTEHKAALEAWGVGCGVTHLSAESNVSAAFYLLCYNCQHAVPPTAV